MMGRYAWLGGALAQTTGLEGEWGPSVSEVKLTRYKRVLATNEGLGWGLGTER